MQVRIYRDGKWLHVMLDDEAQSAIGKSLTELFESLSERARVTPPIVARPVMSVPSEAYLKKVEALKKEEELKQIKIGLGKEIGKKQTEEESKKEEAASS